MNKQKLVLRAMLGSPLSKDHLKRLGCKNPSAVIFNLKKREDVDIRTTESVRGKQFYYLEHTIENLNIARKYVGIGLLKTKAQLRKEMTRRAVDVLTLISCLTFLTLTTFHYFN